MTRLAPGTPEFMDRFSRFRYSAFRLETLPSYAASGEINSLRAFLAGQTPTPHPGKRQWVSWVRAAVQDGRWMQRVHVVAEPLTDYLHYEIAWAYAYNVAAGEDVRIVPVAEGQPWPTELPHSDFWLFDSSELIDMVYAPGGTWLDAELVTDPGKIAAACRVRDAALFLGQPWADYVAARPELARRVPVVPGS